MRASGLRTAYNRISMISFEEFPSLITESLLEDYLPGNEQRYEWMVDIDNGEVS
jgi:hypothetical protein